MSSGSENYWCSKCNAGAEGCGHEIPLTTEELQRLVREELTSMRGSTPTLVELTMNSITPSMWPVIVIALNKGR